MCFCDATNPLPYCGAAECVSKDDPFGLSIFDQPLGCPHKTITIEKRMHHFEGTNKRCLEVRLRCADCKAPFLFDGMAQDEGNHVDLEGPSTDLTRRIGRLVIHPEGESV